ncbi:hypothetical protein [Rhizobacter sp. SG703]|uniref:hypothetical protein n=1 Tax=Rhizobacter sp. SG703 TaxID=2587140 RepID=UPI00144606F0|nr:hypothetical protein [Rhizobacter sp. SG703]NKI94067.1 putative membrane protein YphA (DoxX/SURF4 family) [Rhizobacter sp. SG703]
MGKNNVTSTPSGNPGSWTISTLAVDRFGTSLADVQQILAAAMGFTFDGSVRIGGDDDDQYLYIDRDGGVPTLPRPIYDFATAIAELSAQVSEGYAGAISNNLEQAKASFDERKACDEKRGDSLRKAMDAMKECEATQGKSRQVTIGRSSTALIAAVILSLCVLVSPLTGGALIAAGVAAVVGVAIAAGQLATTVYAANGVQVANADGTMRNKDVTIGGMVTALTEHLRKNGHLEDWSDEKISKWEQGWTMALNITITLAMMAASGAGYRQIRSLVKDAKAGIEQAMAQLKGAHVGLEQGARVAETVTTLSDASLTIVDGHLQKVQGDLTLVSDLATAMKEFMTSLSSQLSSQAQAYCDAFERNMKAMDDGMNLTDDLLRLLNRADRPSAMLG